ncbi:MAG TPA: beta-galactosidase [bacterium]|nr:beta-galactosidase [bacterium]
MDDRSKEPFVLTIGGTRDSRASLRVIDHKFVIGKEEFPPFAAEMHYFRVAKRHWSICFERIRKANFRIISTAVPWNIHEPRQGELDFAGTTDPARDLIVFLELCREFGFKILLRPGPWVASECDNGGLPEFVLRHPENVATNHAGEPVIAEPGGGAKPVPLPPYLGNRFQIQLKNYFAVLSEVVKNYIYPRGPVFMIELDHETSFGGHFDPFSADYSPQGSRAHFARFLSEKYHGIDKLNKVWKAKLKDFGEAVPPDPSIGKSPHEFLRLMDWVEFREWTVNRYADFLAELLSQTEVSVLFTRSLAFNGAYFFPDLAGARNNGRTIFTVNLDWDRPFAQTVRRARSVSGWQPTGFAGRLSVGNRHADPVAGHAYHPITSLDTKRLIVASLAAGLKGFNYHMFVGRQRWYDGALESDGAILPSFDIVSQATTRLVELKFETMRDFADVALAQYRPYLRAASVGEYDPDGYIGDLVGAGFDAIAADLMALSHDYRIFELGVTDRLDKYGTIIVPCGETMDAATQERLADLAKGGAHLIIYGAVPTRDEHYEPCEVLAKAIGFKTAIERAITEVETKAGKFTVNALGTIKRAPTRAAKLAKSGAKLLAASNKCGKGQVTVLTFAPGSHLHPEKLVFFKEVLAQSKLDSPVWCSDPRVHVAVQVHQKGGLLMVYDIAETTGVTDQSLAASVRSVIVSVDLAMIGLAAPKVSLTDFLGTEVHRVAAKDLKSGIELRLGRGDSRLFSIEKK